jgi:hypothetical protein
VIICSNGRSVLLDCRIFDHNAKLERLLIISAAKNSIPEQSIRNQILPGFQRKAKKTSMLTSVESWSSSNFVYIR